MLTTISLSANAVDSSPAPDGRQTSITEAGFSSLHYYEAPLQRTQPADASLSANKRTTLNHQYGLWLYDVVIGFNNDYDNDGHYSNFSITLDFDTSLITPLVYAVLYVSIDDGPWNEYAVSGDFTINGSNAYDAYTIHATLDSGYPTGYYNHYVELYDAYSHEFLTGYGPDDNHYFHHLPFESSVHDHHTGFASSVSLRFTGTGSIGPFSLCLLVMLFGLQLKRYVRRSQTMH